MARISDDTRLYTSGQGAARLGVSSSTFRRWAKDAGETPLGVKGRWPRWTQGQVQRIGLQRPGDDEGDGSLSLDLFRRRSWR